MGEDYPDRMLISNYGIYTKWLGGDWDITVTYFNLKTGKLRSMNLTCVIVDPRKRGP